MEPGQSQTGLERLCQSGHWFGGRVDQPDYDAVRVAGLPQERPGLGRVADYRCRPGTGCTREYSPCWRARWAELPLWRSLGPPSICTIAFLSTAYSTASRTSLLVKARVLVEGQQAGR